MSAADMEDELAARLRAYADAESVQPDRRARRDVARHTAVLRRRRRTRRSGVAVAACVTVVGGLVWLGAEDDTASVVTEPDGRASWELGPPPADTPAFTVEGLVPVDGESGVYDPPREGVSSVTEEGIDERAGVQAFRRPRDYGGPTVHVSYGPTVAQGNAPATTVPLARGTGGRMVETSPMSARLSWRPAGGTGVAVAVANGLSADELRGVVDGLVLRPDGSGFDATALPAGMAEDPIEPPVDRSLMWSAYRALRLIGGDGGTVAGPVQINVTRSDEADFESMMADRVAAAASVDQVTVVGHPAVLVRYRSQGRWSVLWRHNRADWVEVDVMAADRATVDHLLDSLHEIDTAAFQDLLDQAGEHPEANTSDSTAVTHASPPTS